jgi:hypothetical protein
VKRIAVLSEAALGLDPGVDTGSRQENTSPKSDNLIVEPPRAPAVFPAWQ